jgi:uncharacterized protein with ParB-like and HNH nuclease domain
MLKLIDGNKLPVVSLEEYFNQHRTLVIPPWQREYSWGDQQVETLLDDLKNFYENKGVSQYLLGSIILCEENVDGEKSEPLLIDGQQRSLTLTLFLMCARKYLKTNNLIDGTSDKHTKLSQDILNCLTDNPEGRYFPKVSMNQAKANEILAELFDWSNTTSPTVGADIFQRADLQTRTQRNLSEVAKAIYSKFQSNEWVLLDDFIPALIKIMDGIKLIELTVTDKRESIAIFDRINDRGMILSKADLIKNIIFSRVSDKEFDLISDNWNEMSEKLMETKKVRLQDPKYLLRAMSHVQFGAHPGYDNLATFWEDKFNDAETRISAKSFSDSLPVNAKSLLSLVKGEHPDFQSIPEIFLASELGSVQHYSVLLAGSQISDEKAYRTLMSQVNYRTMLYMLSKERTQSFDLMVPEWANAVHALKAGATVEQLKEVYRNVALPTDEIFYNLQMRMSEWLYGSAGDRKKMRAVLALLSTHLNNACGKPLKIQDAMRSSRRAGIQPWQLEHIAPQSRNTEPIWHGIGNLVLLAPTDNLEASDKDPSLKKLHYNQSELVLTKTLSDMPIVNTSATKVSELYSKLGNFAPSWSLDSWDKKAIDARGEFYYKYLVHVFKSLES